MLEFIFDLIFHLYEPERIPFPFAVSSVVSNREGSLLAGRRLLSQFAAECPPVPPAAAPGTPEGVWLSRGGAEDRPRRCRSGSVPAPMGPDRLVHQPHGSVLHTSKGWFPPARTPDSGPLFPHLAPAPGGDLSAGDTALLCVFRAAAQASLGCPQPRAPVLLVLLRLCPPITRPRWLPQNSPPFPPSETSRARWDFLPTCLWTRPAASRALAYWPVRRVPRSLPTALCCAPAECRGWGVVRAGTRGLGYTSGSLRLGMSLGQ